MNDSIQQPPASTPVAPPRRKRDLKIAGALLVLIAIEVAIWIASGRSIVAARRHFDDGRYEAARIELKRTDWIPFRRADRDWMSAAIGLALGDSTGEALPRVRDRGLRIFTPLQRVDVLDVLVRRGEFEEAVLWSEIARGLLGPRARERLLRAAALIGSGRVDDGTLMLSSVSDNGDWSSQVMALRTALSDRKRGITPVVLDSKGRVLALWRFADQTIVVADPSAATLIRALQRDGTVTGPWPVLHLSLDVERQRRVDALLEGRNGAIAVVNPATGAVVALASSDDVDPLQPVALGSLGRIGMPQVESVYPVLCRGLLHAGPATILDVGRHGAVPDHETALTWGCSVAAGKSGIAAGAASVTRLMTDLGFDAGPTTDADIALLASTEGKAMATPLRLAALAGGVATDGSVQLPRITAHRTSILGETLDSSPSQVVMVPAEAVERLREVMRRSVLEERGDAHALAVSRLDALAFGGNYAAGEMYSARIAGYGPVEQPRLAVAVVLDDRGPVRVAAADLFASVMREMNYENYSVD